MFPQEFCWVILHLLKAWCQEKVSWTNPRLHLGISIETWHLCTVELLLAAYDTKSQKKARLDPEWRCDWHVFHKPKKPIDWVSQETNSSTSFGVFSSSVWLSQHTFSRYSNYRAEKEAPKLEGKSNVFAHAHLPNKQGLGIHYQLWIPLL